MNRIDRLTAILIQLQTKRIVKAEEVAERFEISLRTVYRDVKALMEAGVPIGSEAGKGYFIVDGFHLPPVMFTTDEASSLILAGKLVEKMTDKSIQSSFDSAVLKIKAVLNDTEKDRLESLQSYIEVMPSPRQENPFPDHFLTSIQAAVVQKDVIRIEYFSGYNEANTIRDVEPIGLFYYSAAWHLIAWCRLRNGYRDFRADRIKSMKRTDLRFDPRNLLSLKEYLATIMQANREVEKIVVVFEKNCVRYVGNARYNYGFVSEEDLEDKIRMTFLTSHSGSLCRWLLMFGNRVEIESPEKAKELSQELIDELVAHHQRVPQV